MASLTDFQSLLGAEGGLGVVATTRPDGSIQGSVVNVGVLDHPVRGEPAAGFVARGATVKLANLRRDPRVTIVARAGWQWIAVEGTAELVGPDDSMDGFDAAQLPELLRSVFRAAGGDHDDWPAYDRAMVEEARAAVLVSPTRVYSNRGA